METERYKSLSDFYPFYLTEHLNPVSRTLHFVGTSIVCMMFFTAIFTQHWSLMLYIPLIGYGFAWVGHFFFEKNKPATFQYPLWSLASDFKLFWDLLRGKEKFSN